MKARIDQEAPTCASIKLDGAKRKQLQADRQAEVDLVSLIDPEDCLRNMICDAWVSCIAGEQDSA